VEIASEESTIGSVISEQSVLQDSRVGITIAQNAELNNSSTLILLAREVDGNVETVLDTRGALALGLSAGIVAGLMLLVGNLLRRD